ncbi:PREDICTED: uncharacterized protein LOC109116043 [Tarenaya hassleriana]|uniref:uncharacterized protein LOC109116043 n=1 Tax=Tarenaya hassleriana TaxID=28532 RepID=UPI0008FD3CD4|nr:PREDICTED: uncharacterized protein LOC109116043 [Tarenaya hassleriana]
MLSEMAVGIYAELGMSEYNSCTPFLQGKNHHEATKALIPIFGGERVTSTRLIFAQETHGTIYGDQQVMFHGIGWSSTEGSQLRIDLLNGAFKRQTEKFGERPPLDIGKTVVWLNHPTILTSRAEVLLKKLLSHLVVYELWNERNGRIHRNLSNSSHQLRLKIDKSMRNILISLQKQETIDSNEFIQLCIIAMEALSRKLDKSAAIGHLQLHTKCADPMLTHLIFADDLVIFCKATQQSLQTIQSCLTWFGRNSGLEVNPGKCEIFLGGLSDQRQQELAAFMGIALGKFPMRYLGLPVSTQRLSKADYEPLMERVRNKVSSWSSKVLSYAGKIQLVATVIYGMVNSWSQTRSGRARVAWNAICLPKREGGLGLKKLEDSNKVFRLKMIWSLFKDASSLWVAWVKKNVLKRGSFWNTTPIPRMSWNFRKLLKLKELATQYIRCRIGNGNTASFWHDSWTTFGPLLEYIGNNGPRLLRIPITGKVSAAISGGNWFLPGARSQRIQELHIHLLSISVPDQTAEDDKYEWKVAENVAEIWQGIARKIWSNPPGDLVICNSWLNGVLQSDGRNRKILMQCLIQHVIYESELPSCHYNRLEKTEATLCFRIGIHLRLRKRY